MLIPIRHEHMSARRWPVITFALIAINVLVFLFTHGTMEEQSPKLGEVKAHILMLAAMHPELSLNGDAQQFVEGFREQEPAMWKRLQNPGHGAHDAWDARIRQLTEIEALQAEMDSLTDEYAQLTGESLTQGYAFVPAHPKPWSYVTANFLHGGWLHLIGNMWFLWLAGFVLEDVWGRPLYTIFYFVAGAAALQFYAWTNAGSMVPTIGASGAVAALMGAFLVRFPNMKIEMAWLFLFRVYRFKAPAYWLLPLWLVMEVFSGAVFGSMSGVAHWAHVGGFLTGALVAACLRYSGWEQKADQAIEEKVSWSVDPKIDEATALIEKEELGGALGILQPYVLQHPDSVDAYSLLGQIYWKQNQIVPYHDVIAKLCALHLKARATEAAWQDYEDFVNSGGEKMPAATWFEICRIAEEQEKFDRALAEYEKLAATYPSERQSVLALLAAGRICLKKLTRPQDALRFYEAAGRSAVPHLDCEQDIQFGIRGAKAALSAAMSCATT